MNAKRQTRGNLLIDEPPLMVLPRLAKAIGLNEAIVLQQLHFLLKNPENGATVGGARYIYNTYQEWQKHFEFFSEPTVKRTFLNLERQGLVTSVKANKRKHDHRKFYRIEYDSLDRLESANAGATDQVESKTKRSVRSDQIDPIRTDQIEPFLYRQRRQQKEQQRNPPTPEPSFGGSSDFPGKEIEPTHGNVLGADPTAKGDWLVKAMAYPAAPAFLTLADLAEFPATGRQPLARAFVGACEREVITPRRLQLIANVKERIRLPDSPEQLIKTFGNVAEDAREVAGERLVEIDRQLNPAASDLASLLRMMVGADQHAATFTPEEAFAPGMGLPFPRWLLLAVFIKRGVAVESWTERLAAQVTSELIADLGVVPFLNQIGIAVSALGTAVAQIDDARRERRATLTKESSVLSDLLMDDSASAMKAAA